LRIFDGRAKSRPDLRKRDIHVRSLRAVTWASVRECLLRVVEGWRGASRPVYLDRATRARSGDGATTPGRVPKLGCGPSRCSRIMRRARSSCSGRTTIARGPPIVSPSIAPDPRFVTRCMHWTPASRRIATRGWPPTRSRQPPARRDHPRPDSIAERAFRPSPEREDGDT